MAGGSSFYFYHAWNYNCPHEFSSKLKDAWNTTNYLTSKISELCETLSVSHIISKLCARWDTLLNELYFVLNLTLIIPSHDDHSRWPTLEVIVQFESKGEIRQGTDSYDSDVRVFSAMFSSPHKFSSRNERFFTILSEFSVLLFLRLVDSN